MRLSWSRSASTHRPIVTSALSLLSLSSIAHTFDFRPVARPNLDFSKLGEVGVAGDFEGISFYEFDGQSEKPASNNGSESLFTQLPNNLFASLAPADASITAMCALQNDQGDFTSIIVGGDFTSLDGKQTSGLALFDPRNEKVESISGLEGQVKTLLCESSGLVYVGGNFKADNSTNAITWSQADGWTSLPFSGFNGPVNSIVKASNGHIVFGGSFTGLGNATTISSENPQVLNLGSSSISDAAGTNTAGFEPSNIVCKSSESDGPGNSWHLLDNTPGFWRATFGFTFQPSRIRLWNTRFEGRGTKTWRLTALPLDGIMNLTYTDPATGRNASCQSECPLSDDPDVPFQDFYFVNKVDMNDFRIDISDWYGSSGGLAGIEVFQDDVFSYAISDFNEPTCSAPNSAGMQKASTTGPWTEAPSSQSSSRYLTANIPSPIREDSASVTFFPDIKEAGDYFVNMYTPGCLQDNSCNNRGEVKVTGRMISDNEESFSTTLFQTNNFDKFDQIYFGRIETTDTAFRPSITLSPVEGQNLQTMTLVAQRVGFILGNATDGLNGLFDFDRDNFDANKLDLSKSAINKLGTNFSKTAEVTSLVVSGDELYIAGNFSRDDDQSAMAFDTSASQPVSLDRGIKGLVSTQWKEGSTIFVGGQFTETVSGSMTELNNIAAYNTDEKTWEAVGKGVNGKVKYVVPMLLNITEDNRETVITFSGDFTKCHGYDGNSDIDVSGFAVWVPSARTWLENMKDGPKIRYGGSLTASLLNVFDNFSLFSGTLSSAMVAGNGIAEITDGDLSPYPISLSLPSTDSSSSSKKLGRRDSIVSTGNIHGVVTGLFDESNDRDLTILAGRFSTNEGQVQNLAIIDNKDDGKVTGLGNALPEDAVFMALGVQDDFLYAGGKFEATIEDEKVSAFVVYNLVSRQLESTQPPALSGGNATVTAIAVQPETNDVFVAGSFSLAGSLPCPGICLYANDQRQWNQPGINMRGDVTSLMWIGDKTLLAGGNLTVNDTQALNLASYNTDSQTWVGFAGFDEIPGPVEAVTLGSVEGDQIWIAGHATSDGSVYIMKHDGQRWFRVENSLGASTVINSLQVFTVTENHDSTETLPENQSLVLAGSIALGEFGTASAVVYDGKSFQPYLLTTNEVGRGGTVAKIFSRNQNFFDTDGGHMALGFVVLIGLAISLALILLIVLAGFLLDRYRKKRDGYVPAPTSAKDRSASLQQIPPQELFKGLGREHRV